MRSHGYPLPIYLNQKYVFDLLAIMEDGLAQVEAIRSTSTQQIEQSSRLSGGLGLSNVFAFVQVGLRGDKSKNDQSGESHESYREKVHTPNSLFAKVRERLIAEEMIISCELDRSSAGQFVEFKAELRVNPLIGALEGFKSLVELAEIFDEPSPQGHNQRSKAHSQNKNMLGQISGMINQLKAGGTLDLVGSSVDADAMNFVVTLDNSFLNDSAATDLASGQYSILGKVVRSIPAADKDSIDLLRKTSLGLVQQDTLDNLLRDLSKVSEHGIKLPELTTQISGPALHIMPIAIFA